MNLPSFHPSKLYVFAGIIILQIFHSSRTYHCNVIHGPSLPTLFFISHTLFSQPGQGSNTWHILTYILYSFWFVTWFPCLVLQWLFVGVMEKKCLLSNPLSSMTGDFCTYWWVLKHHCLLSLFTLKEFRTDPEQFRFISPDWCANFLVFHFVLSFFSSAILHPADWHPHGCYCNMRECLHW